MEKDYFGYNDPIYVFDRINMRRGIHLNDGTHIIYANASCKDDSEAGKLLSGFLCADPKDIKCEILRKKAASLKNNTTGGAPMSEIVENYAKQYAEQYAETVSLNNIRNLTVNMNWSVLQAMDALGIPDDVREDYCEKLRQDGYE